MACARLQDIKATLNRLSDARQQVEKLETEEGQAQAALLQTEVSIVESRRRAQELQQQVVQLAGDMKVRAHIDAAVTCLVANRACQQKVRSAEGLQAGFLQPEQQLNLYWMSSSCRKGS